MSNKATGRNYQYDTAYESTPLQKKRRAARNAARAKMIKAGKISKGSPLDIDHISRSPGKNLSNSLSNLRAQSKKKNRARND